MSRRITLTEDDIELFVYLLGYMNPITPYSQMERFAVQRRDQLLSKLKSQHPRSVETLDVSGNGDKQSIAQEGKS